MEPNEVGSGLHAGGFIWLVLESDPDFEKTTLELQERKKEELWIF